MNSMRYLASSLSWISFFAAIVLTWYFYLRARNKERMALIEKGVDVSEIFAKREGTFRFPWLKLGIIITGISIGVSLVVFMMIIFPENNIFNDGALMLISGILFGGISMIIAYYVDKPVKKG